MHSDRNKLVVPFLFLVLRLTQSSMEVTMTPINEDDAGVDTDQLFNSGQHVASDSVSTQFLDIVVDKTTHSQEKDKIIQTDNFQNSECDAQNKKIIAVPDLNNCSNYYELCLHNSNLSETQLMSLNLTKVKSCPIGSLFDSLDTRCVQKDNAYCGVYNCVEPDGLYLDPTNNYSFIHCFDGVPQRKKCQPKGTVFVKDKKTCTWSSVELPFTLKLFQGFIWFIKQTETQLDPSTFHSYSHIYSTTDFIIIGFVATLVPFFYIFTIVFLYNRWNAQTKYRESSSFVPDLNDFAHRYYRRPTVTRSSGFINLQPLSQPSSSNSNAMRDSYFVSTSF